MWSMHVHPASGIVPGREGGDLWSLPADEFIFPGERQVT